jgi:hypothetical protein
MGIDQERGLLDVLSDSQVSFADVMFRTEVPGLHVVPAGRASEASTELIASARMAQALGELLRDEPRAIVIFDSSPILLSTDSRALADAVGQVLLVVRADSTPRASVMEAISALGAASGWCSTNTRVRRCKRAITATTKRSAPPRRVDRNVNRRRGTWRKTGRNMTHHRRLLVPMLLAASAGAHAADAELTLHAGNTYTDNALRTLDGPSDNIGAVAARLDVSAQGDRYEANLRTALTYFHYFEGTQDDEVLRGLAGDVRFFIVPERFTWTIQENYGPVLENPLSSDRPDNWAYEPVRTCSSATPAGSTRCSRGATRAPITRMTWFPATSSTAGP